MVITTKNLYYAVDGGSMDKTNSVNMTITSSPAFNGKYLGKLPGVLKLLALILTIIALGLVAALRHEDRLYDFKVVDNRTISNGTFTFMKEMFLAGEVYFLCAHTAVLTVLAIFFLSYLFHTVSSILAPKGTTLEVVAFPLMAIMMLVAGICELAQTNCWKSYTCGGWNLRLMSFREEGYRTAAGVLALINAVVLIVAFRIAKKEFDGPRPNTLIKNDLTTPIVIEHPINTATV